MGMARPRHIEDALAKFDELLYRVHIRWVGSICKGGIYVITVYLYHSEGLSDRNLNILQALAAIISRLKGPWIIAGDFNLDPAEVIGSGWLMLVDGLLRAPVVETCGGSMYDYFIVPRYMDKVIVGVSRIKKMACSRTFLQGYT